MGNKTRRYRLLVGACPLKKVHLVIGRRVLQGKRRSLHRVYQESEQHRGRSPLSSRSAESPHMQFSTDASRVKF